MSMNWPISIKTSLDGQKGVSAWWCVMQKTVTDLRIPQRTGWPAVPTTSAQWAVCAVWWLRIKIIPVFATEQLQMTPYPLRSNGKWLRVRYGAIMTPYQMICGSPFKMVVNLDFWHLWVFFLLVLKKVSRMAKSFQKSESQTVFRLFFGK